MILRIEGQVARHPGQVRIVARLQFLQGQVGIILQPAVGIAISSIHYLYHIITQIGRIGFALRLSGGRLLCLPCGQGVGEQIERIEQLRLPSHRLLTKLRRIARREARLRVGGQIDPLIAVLHLLAHPLGDAGIGTKEAEPESDREKHLLLQAADLSIRPDKVLII